MFCRKNYLGKKDFNVVLNGHDKSFYPVFKAADVGNVLPIKYAPFKCDVEVLLGKPPHVFQI